MPCIELPNIGREAHTYLYHIVSNYYNLTDWTFFLQGNPFDHCHNINSIIKQFPDEKDLMHKYSDGCYGIADRYLNETVEELNKILVFPEIIQKDFFEIDRVKFHYACGAQYAVHKNNIRNKPWQFYFDMLNFYPWTEHEPWSMERLWPQIFDDKDNFKYKIKNLGR